jgi:hypothetical protein
MGVEPQPSAGSDARSEMVRRGFVIAAGLILFLSLPKAQANAASGFKVIVNPGVKGASISRDVLAQVFLGRVERWGNGTPITPVDLSAMSSVRAAFSEEMLGMPMAAVRRYWEQRLVAGHRPPMVKTSTEDMIAAVASEQGAIGYLPEETPVPDTVKVIQVQ